MWDGSFRSKKQVSLRGKSARQADRDDVKDRVRRERHHLVPGGSRVSRVAGSVRPEWGGRHDHDERNRRAAPRDRAGVVVVVVSHTHWKT